MTPMMTPVTMIVGAATSKRTMLWATLIRRSWPLTVVLCRGDQITQIEVVMFAAAHGYGHCEVAGCLRQVFAASGTMFVECTHRDLLSSLRHGALITRSASVKHSWKIRTAVRLGGYVAWHYIYDAHQYGGENSRGFYSYIHNFCLLII